MEFDLIISTTDAGQKDFPLDDYLSYSFPPFPDFELIRSMLDVNGTFNQCGLPNDSLPSISPFTFISVRVSQLYSSSDKNRMADTCLDLISGIKRRRLRC